MLRWRGGGVVVVVCVAVTYVGLCFFSFPFSNRCLLIMHPYEVTIAVFWNNSIIVRNKQHDDWNVCGRCGLGVCHR